MYQGQKSQTKLTDSCRYPRILCSALSVSVLPSRGIESAVEHGQSFLFDISSLLDAYEVVNAELRVLPWRSPEPDPDSATLPPLLHLFVCPDAGHISSTALADCRAPRSRVLGRVGRDRRGEEPPANSAWYCRRPDFRLARGGSGDDTGAKERALLVSSSRTQRKRVCSQEIRAQARALQATAELPPDLGPGAGEATPADSGAGGYPGSSEL